MSDDPERLVSEALRAHAARTPLPDKENTGPTLGGFGLLSGSEVTVPQDDPPTVRAAPPPDRTDRTARLEPDPRVAAGWVILLAVLLGLASGAVVGLLTLL